MAKITFKGFKQLDGTTPGFTTDGLEDGYIYFIRTSGDEEDGYLFFNGKKYGRDHVIDCGTY